MLEKKETSKSLGILEANVIKQAEMKENIEKKYHKRTMKLHESKVYCRNLTKGINTRVVLLVRYSGPIFKWMREKKLQQLDQRTRKLITINMSM